METENLTGIDLIKIWKFACKSKKYEKHTVLVGGQTQSFIARNILIRENCTLSLMNRGGSSDISILIRFMNITQYINLEQYLELDVLFNHKKQKIFLKKNLKKFFKKN